MNVRFLDYDEEGRLHRQSWTTQGTTEFWAETKFESGGEVLWKTFSDGDGVGSAAVPWLYDTAGPPQAMHSPPSTTRAWPVMKDERSEARKRMASAISSTLAKRPIGIFPLT